MSFDSDDERADEGVIYTSWDGKVARSGSSVSLRARVFGLAGAGKPRDAHKTITTAPGVLGAGETETESEDVPRHLPTSRIVPASPPLIPPNTLRRLTPLLFEFSRLLSIVPALFGALYNIYHIIYPPAHGPLRIDYIVSVLWCILTGAQCLRLTTGLLVRWRVYYTPLPTLIRLLALQAICWPATHFTLTLLGHTQRPVICWAAVATTTSCSRAVQMWVTSNLVLAPAPAGDGASTPGGTHSHAHGHAHSHGHAHLHGRGSRRGSRSTLDAALALAGAAGPGAPADVDVDGGGAPATARRSGRRWDWRRVGVQCALPAGAVYVVMAWAEALRREFAGC